MVDEDCKYRAWAERNELLRKEFEPRFKIVYEQLKELNKEYNKRSYEIYKDLFKS